MRTGSLRSAWRRRTFSTLSAYLGWKNGIRPNCRAVNSNVSPLHARWCWEPISYWRTNPPATSIRRARRQFLICLPIWHNAVDVEDLASPGEFVWHLDEASSRACWILRVGGNGALEPHRPQYVEEMTDTALSVERTRRRGFPTVLDRSADAYLAKRGAGRTIVAGYPWFTDWGRDTFIAVRGLCLATGRLHDARDILLEWSAAVSAHAVLRSPSLSG
jgi:hypothetical protein